MSKLNCIDVIISKSNYRLTPILVVVERSLISKSYFREGLQLVCLNVEKVT